DSKADRRPVGGNGGDARRLVEQRELAEKVALAEACDLRAVPDDPSAARDDEEEARSDLALAHDAAAVREFDLDGPIGDRGQRYDATATDEAGRGAGRAGLRGEGWRARKRSSTRSREWRCSPISRRHSSRASPTSSMKRGSRPASASSGRASPAAVSM